MDLIREELLRQRKALEMLFLGTGQQAESLQQESAGQTQWMVEAESAATGELPDGELSPAGNRVLRSSREIWSQESARAIVAPEARPSQGTHTGELPEEPVARGSVPAFLDPAQTVASGGAAAGSQSREGRLVTEYVMAGRSSGTGAKEVSRAFERDARRYDGGFTS